VYHQRLKGRTPNRASRWRPKATKAERSTGGKSCVISCRFAPTQDWRLMMSGGAVCYREPKGRPSEPYRSIRRVDFARLL
jgi:hypothetical protein